MFFSSTSFIGSPFRDSLQQFSLSDNLAGVFFTLFLSFLELSLGPESQSPFHGEITSEMARRGFISPLYFYRPSYLR